MTITPEVLILIGQVLVKYGPTAVRQLVALFNKKEVTEKDVLDYITAVEGMTFDKLFNKQT